MSNLANTAGNAVKAAFYSGGPGTTGREPFEDSTATGPAPKYLAHDGNHSSHSGTGAVGIGGGNVGSHVHGHHSHEGGGHIAGVGAGAASSGLTGAGGSPTSSGRPIGASSTIANVGTHGTETSQPTAGVSGFGGSQNPNTVGGANSQTTGIGHGGQSGQTGNHSDKVGALGQDQSKYESTGINGPTSSGAAGTERFDTDKSHSGTGTGTTGSVGGYADGVTQETGGPRAPEKSTGGVSGLLATSDKDFTGRDRLGSGAYADTHGPFKTNTSGPAGNTALTGREGTLENNPVHKANTKDSAATAGASTSPTKADESGEKKGFMQKVKDALKEV